MKKIFVLLGILFLTACELTVPPEESHSIGGSQEIEGLTIHLREVEDNSSTIFVKIKIWGDKANVNNDNFKLLLSDNAEVGYQTTIITSTDEYALITFRYDNAKTDVYTFVYNDPDLTVDPYWEFTFEEVE